MRIHAIRGKNLASIEGDFAIELDLEPLAQAGLFAITGPTGSGKSTILDALSLALYDRTPRLSRQSTVEIGRADDDDSMRIGDSDVRSVLRRGSAAGYAEVDFSGNDDRRYRSRWQVRRARNRPDGRLQQQELILTDLESGAPTGRTKTEVLEIIERIIGLSFDQFRRAVLLAQGDFAAFLKADDSDRAGLLEKITGTQIYGEISMAAYRRAVSEKERLERIGDRLDGIKPLDGEERKELESKRRRTRQILKNLESERQKCERALKWFEVLKRLKEDRILAERERDEAHEAVTAADSRRVELGEIIDAQGCRSRVEAHDRAVKEHDNAERELKKAGKKHANAAGMTKSAEIERKLAAGGREEARNKERSLKKPISEARRLDTRISEAMKQLEDRRIERDEALKGSKKFNDERDRLEKKKTTVEKKVKIHSVWLEEHDHLRGLVKNWSLCDSELKRYAVAREEERSHSGNMSTLERELQLKEKKRTRLEKDHAVCGVEFDGAREKTTELEKNLAKLSLEDLRKRREEWTGKKDTFQHCMDGVKKAGESLEALAESERQVKESTTLMDRSMRTVDFEKDRIRRKKTTLDEAEHALQLSVLAGEEAVIRMRQMLREGDECPVCGATEHPVAGGELVLDEVVSRHRERVRELKKILEEHTSRKARAESDLDNAEKQITAENGRMNKNQKELKRLQSWWEDEIKRTDLPGDIVDENLPDLLEERLKAARSHLRHILREEEKALLLKKEAERMRKKVEDLRRERDGVKEKISGIGQGIDVLVFEQKKLNVRLSAAQSVMQETINGLRTHLSRVDGWESDLHEKPKDFRATCGKWVSGWKSHEAQKEQADRELKKFEAESTRIKTNCEHAFEQVEKLQAAFDRQDESLANIMKERKRYLDGRDADQLDQEIEREIKETETRHEEASGRLQTAERELAAATEEKYHWSREEEARRVELEKRRKTLDILLVECDIMLKMLRKRLEKDQIWIKGEQAALDKIRHSLERALTLCEERGEKILEHERSGHPDLTEEEAAGQLEELDSRRETATEEHVQAAAALKQDDENRRKSSELTGELQEQKRVCDLWESMRELIGSANGNKFRLFAQSLTLDTLLAHANQHLKELARRYRLQRVPGTDLSLQVMDLDMGDEVRSINSLSGGESFLVSLALALGLASLSSRQTRVESLFIDEGFGTLDPDTLDTAIACLDALQSQGRQVGVISHVQTMVERIGVQVRVDAQGGGRSSVSIIGL